MQLRPFSIRHLLLKLAIFAAIFYVVVIAISILITGFLFISLDSYKTRIEGVIFRHTGYTLTIDNIKTKLNQNYLPEVIISGAKLTNPSNVAQNFSVKRLEFVFSYSSIWNLEPIFNQINIDGTNINLEYLTDNSIVFNGININHPDEKTIQNTKNSPIDLENWLLKQEQIKLTNINLHFTDKKNNLPTITLKNVTTTLINKSMQHDFSITVGVGEGDKPNLVGAELSWIGGKVTQFEKWQEAELKVQTYNNADTLTGTLEEYFPGISILQEFNAETALDAQVKNGKLQFLFANFDIKNLQYALKNSVNMLNFPQLGGNIRITLVNGDNYRLEANNLTIATPDGYVLNNKSINGNYHLNRQGQLSIANTKLKPFNNVIAMLPIKNINLDGEIEILKLNWLGDIFHPTGYTVYSKFNNLAILSKNEDIPSLNNLSGDITFTQESGVLNLALKNSTLIYKKVFLIPYKFKSLTSKITWNFNQDKSIDVVLNPTQLETIDFKGNAYGKYKYVPGTSGYLELNAHLDKVLTSKVGDYLPKVIGQDVHKWLKMALIGGYGVNGNLQLKGWLHDFPYDNGKGIFYITATIDNAKLRYIQDWPTLDNLQGTFAIRNQKILITATSGQVLTNRIQNATVTIPSMIAKNAYLVANGQAAGITANFMRFLQKTPINEIIGKLPEKVTTQGNGKVNLHLQVPFDKPEQTTVKGVYTFYNNQIKFDLPIPITNEVNGNLYFTDHGVKIEQIKATAFDSTLLLTANTLNNGIMQFKIQSPNLNYNEATSFYTPFLSRLINGTAPTSIYFNIGKGGVSQIGVNSTLQGVKLAMPIPLAKDATEIRSLNFTLLNKEPNFVINVNYANLFFANLVLNQQGQINHGQLAIGSNDFANLNLNNAKLLINVNLNEVYASQYFTMIKQLIAGEKEQSIESNDLIEEAKDTTIKPTAKIGSAGPNIFPLEVLLTTNNLYAESNNFHKTSADILVTNNQAIFSLNNAQANGYGTYAYDLKQLNLFLNEFNLYKVLSNSTTTATLASLTKEEKAKDIPESTIATTLATNPNLITTANNLPAESMPNTTLDFPTTNILIGQFYYENHSLGQFSVRLKPKGQDLLIESGELINSSIARILINGINYCMECGVKQALVKLQIEARIMDLGSLLEDLNYGKVVSKGKGTLAATIQWPGQLQDFEVDHALASINVNLKTGKFLKVNTGSFIGSVIGLINLQTLVSFAKLQFGDIFQNGFYFDQLNIQAYLINNNINLNNLYMSGPLATVNSKGTVDIPHDSLNLYLAVTPRLGISVAVGAALATANPIVGIATYAAEWILGQPFNKLFTFSFHVTGSITKPDVKQISVSKQIIKNVNSAIGN